MSRETSCLYQFLSLAAIGQSLSSYLSPLWCCPPTSSFACLILAPKTVSWGILRQSPSDLITWLHQFSFELLTIVNGSTVKLTFWRTSTQETHSVYEMPKILQTSLCFPWHVFWSSVVNFRVSNAYSYMGNEQTDLIFDPRAVLLSVRFLKSNERCAAVPCAILDESFCHQPSSWR